MSKSIVRAGLATCLALVLATGVSSAQENRKVKVINETNHTIVHLYGSNAGEKSWQEDILGQDVLKPGQSVVVNFDDGSGYCKFDVLAKFSDGTKAEQHGVDVCKDAVLRFTGD